MKKNSNLIRILLVSGTLLILSAVGIGGVYLIENHAGGEKESGSVEQTSPISQEDPSESSLLDEKESKSKEETDTDTLLSKEEKTSEEKNESESPSSEIGGTETEEPGSSEESSSEEKTSEESSSEVTSSEEETSEEETPEKTEEETSETETPESETSAPDPREQVLNHYQNLGVVNDVNNYLNVRNEPNLDATVIGKVLKYGGVNILEATAEGWLKISFPYVDCGYGYVYGEFVSQGQDAIALAVNNSLQMISVDTEVLNVREQPNTDCKILTQIITGEHYQVVNIENGWVEITLGVDDKSGEDILAYVSEEFVQLGYYLSEPIEYVPEVTINPVRTAIVEDALQYLGGRYVWGGETLGVGVDCSGFTKQIFAKHGIYLNRVSYDQATQGTQLTDASQLKPGDLVFYSRPGLQIGHVAIYIGNGQVIHAYNPSQGIIITPYNYATPMKMMNIIGD